MTLRDAFFALMRISKAGSVPSNSFEGRTALTQSLLASFITTISAILAASVLSPGSGQIRRSRFIKTRYGAADGSISTGMAHQMSSPFPGFLRTAAGISVATPDGWNGWKTSGGCSAWYRAACMRQIFAVRRQIDQLSARTYQRTADIWHCNPQRAPLWRK